MAQQTINVGTAPNDGTGTPLRTAFQYTNSNFSELYTAVGPSGNNIVVPGTATITGDLTVDTNTLKVDSANDRVGVGTASPAQFVHLSKSNTSTALTAPPVGGASLRIQNTSSTNNNFGSVEFYNANGLFGGSVNCQFTNQATPTNDLVFVTRGSSGGLEHYRIASDGVCTWSDVGGVAGTAMTLNSTGLGVGDSPSYKLHVARTADGTVGYFRRIGATINPALTVYCNETGNTVGFGTDYAGAASPSITFTTAGAERLRIDSSGNVGIGVTPSAWSGNTAIQLKNASSAIAGAIYQGANAGLNANGIAYNCYFDGTNWQYIYGSAHPASRYQQAHGSHSWHIAPSSTGTATFTQAMTLDASGNLLVGTTSASTTSGSGFKVTQPAAGHFDASIVTSANSSIYSCWDIYSTGGTAGYRFYVTSNGTINATNTTISAISDQRLKENVQDIDVGLGAILALKPRKFDWKAGKGKDIKGDRGFIAQEFEQVFPQLVDEWKDAAPEGEAPYKSVRQDLIPVLVKAIQELTARVQTLETR